MATHYEKYDQLIETNLKEIDVEFIKTIQINKDKFHLFFYDYYHENIKDKLPFKILMNLFHFKRQICICCLRYTWEDNHNFYVDKDFKRKW